MTSLDGSGASQRTGAQKPKPGPTCTSSLLTELRRAADEERSSHTASGDDEVFGLNSVVAWLEGLQAGFSGGEKQTGDAVAPTWDAQAKRNDDGVLLWGRFRLRHVLGMGGFGAVFLADDLEQHRAVALKLPRGHVLAERRRLALFAAEPLVAAGLDHPGIVPVFESGVREGIPFLASAYIEGPTLAEWLDKQEQVPTAVAAALVRQLAAATHYAHQRGVLHLDIKPGNVLLDRHAGDAVDSPSHPRLTDFGLARRLDAKATAEPRGLVGTLRYMAPEQLDRNQQQVSVQTDVFALGIVLYELLAKRLPFSAADCTELSREMAEVGPAPLTEMRADVPRDLLAIIARCLKSEPTLRYGSASDLSDDLARFLAGQEVSAHRRGRGERFLARVRTNPWRTGAVAVASVSIFAATIFASYMFQRERRFRLAAEADRHAARRIVDELYTDLAQELSSHPGLEETRRSLLEKALNYYEEVADTPNFDSEQRYEQSLAQSRAATILAELGRTQDALAMRRRCLTTLDQLLTGEAKNTEYLFDRFYNTWQLANEESLLGLKDEAVRDAELALERIEATLQLAPQRLEYREAHCTALTTCWNYLRDQGRGFEAIHFVERAVAESQQLFDAHPEQPLLLRPAAFSRVILLVQACQEERYREAVQLADAAEASFAILIQHRPAEATFHSSLAECRMWRAVALQGVGQLEAGRLSALAAQALWERVQQGFPRTFLLEMQFAAFEFDLGNWYAKSAETETADRCFRASAEHFDQLRQTYPQSVNEIQRRLQTYAESCPTDLGRQSFQTSLEQLRAE